MFTRLSKTPAFVLGVRRKNAGLCAGREVEERRPLCWARDGRTPAFVLGVEMEERRPLCWAWDGRTPAFVLGVRRKNAGLCAVRETEERRPLCWCETEKIAGLCARRSWSSPVRPRRLSALENRPCLVEEPFIGSLDLIETSFETSFISALKNIQKFSHMMTKHKKKR